MRFYSHQVELKVKFNSNFSQVCMGGQVGGGHDMEGNDIREHHMREHKGNAE